MIKNLIAPKRPIAAARGWQYIGRAPSAYTLGYEGHIWLHRESGIAVISAVEVARDKDGVDRGPEYHISISKQGRRCTSDDARFVCRVFQVLDAEEDNHVPHGRVRNFWLPVAEPLIGRECGCKREEPAMVEDKGDFVWRGAAE